MEKEKFCVRCMEKRRLIDGMCPVCGFQPEKYSPASTALPLCSVVGNRYLIGESLYSDGFEQVYMGLDVLSQKRVYLHEFFPVDFAERNIAVSFRVAETEEESYRIGFSFFAARARRLVDYGEAVQCEHDYAQAERIISYFDDNNTFYMVGEARDSVSFGKMIKMKSPQMTFEEVGTVMFQVINAVKELHQRGYFQCDITPEHIMLEEDGVLLLAGGQEKYEFRKETGSKGITPFQGGGAPELFLDETIGSRTDVYAFAAMFYHILSGKVLKDILDKQHKTIQDIRKVNRMKGVPEPILEAVNVGLGIAGKDRAMDFSGFRMLQGLDAFPSRNLKKNLLSGGEGEKKGEIKSSRAMGTQKKTGILFGVVVLIFIVAGGTVFAVSNKNLRNDRKIVQEPHSSADTDVREATAGAVSVAGVLAPTGETVNPSLPDRKEADTAATDVPDKKPQISKKPKPTPKKKIRKKPTHKRPTTRPKPPIHEPTPEPAKPKATIKLKPPEEVISGNGDGRGEENITGAK